MSDAELGVEIAVIEQRQAALEKRFDGLDRTLSDMAKSMQALAEDMHKIATFEYRVGALERAVEKFDNSVRRLHERIDTIDRSTVTHGVKIGGGERLIWIVVTAVVAAIVGLARGV